MKYEESQVTKLIDIETERLQREQGLSDLEELLKTKFGRRMVMQYLDRCGYQKPIFVPSAEVHRKAASHDIGLQLVSDISRLGMKAYKLYLKALEEYAMDQVMRHATAEVNIKEVIQSRQG